MNRRSTRWAPWTVAVSTTLAAVAGLLYGMTWPVKVPMASRSRRAIEKPAAAESVALPGIGELLAVAAVDFQRPLVDPLKPEPQPQVQPVVAPLRVRLVATLHDLNDKDGSMAIVSDCAGRTVTLGVGETFVDLQAGTQFKVLSVSPNAVTVEYAGQQVVVRMEGGPV